MSTFIKYARIIEYDSQPGRTRVFVKCSCGHINQFFLWSWAGNGKASCKGCKKFISYDNLAVFEKIKPGNVKK